MRIGSIVRRRVQMLVEPVQTSPRETIDALERNADGCFGSPVHGRHRTTRGWDEKPYTEAPPS